MKLGVSWKWVGLELEEKNDTQVWGVGKDYLEQQYSITLC